MEITNSTNQSKSKLLEFTGPNYDFGKMREAIKNDGVFLARNLIPIQYVNAIREGYEKILIRRGWAYRTDEGSLETCDVKFPAS